MIDRSVLVVIVVLVLAVGALSGTAGAADPNFDPDDVEIVSIDGESPDQVNAIEVNVTDPIPIELDGFDGPDRPLRVEIGGELLCMINETDASARPRSDTTVTTGQQTLQIVYEDRGERTIVAETEVDVTAVVLERPDGDDGLGFDPDSVEIETIDGQDTTDRPQLELTATDSISIGLDGVDANDVYAQVELDGTHIGTTTQGDSEFRPREGRDVSAGIQSFTLVRDRDGERIVIDEVDVEVTRVDLTRDDPADLDFDPEAVSIESVDGHSPGAIELALSYSETVSVALDGIDVENHVFEVALSGSTIGSIGESDGAFRPRSDSEVEPGEHTLTISKRVKGAEDPVVAETAVTITAVNLERDDDRDGADVDPTAVTLVSVDDKPTDQEIELELSSESPLPIEIEGVTVPERGFRVEIGGSTVGVMHTASEDLRLRRGVNLSTGEQPLDIVWVNEGNRTVLASTTVRVTAVDLDRDSRSEDPTTVDLEIVSVNGQPASGTVVTEYDLRGETPITMEVSGLDGTDLEPVIRYQGETFSPNIEGFEIDGDRLTMSHLPRITDGESASLELVQRTGDEEVHVYDRVTIEYRQVDGKTDLPGDDSQSNVDGSNGEGESTGQDGSGVEEEPTDSEQADSTAEDDDGGILGGIVDAVTGGESEDEDTDQETEAASTETAQTDAEDTTQSPNGEGESDDGGIISFFQDLFGF